MFYCKFKILEEYLHISAKMYNERPQMILKIEIITEIETNNHCGSIIFLWIF